MLGTLFGLPAGEQAALLDLIYPLTEGNPFFVEEPLTALVDRGDLVSTDGGWWLVSHADHVSGGVPVSRTIQEAVQQRTRRLSREAQQVVTLAAVAGRRLDFDLLQAVLFLSDGSADPHLCPARPREKRGPGQLRCLKRRGCRARSAEIGKGAPLAPRGLSPLAHRPSGTSGAAGILRVGPRREVLGPARLQLFPSA